MKILQFLNRKQLNQSVGTLMPCAAGWKSSYRQPEMRKQMLDYWTQLLLSGTAQLLNSQKVSEELVNQMREELDLLKLATDSIFFYAAMQARALA